ncbi:MAG: BON domain-containing protein [Myxococcota bacterium]
MQNWDPRYWQELVESDEPAWDPCAQVRHGLHDELAIHPVHHLEHDEVRAEHFYSWPAPEGNWGVMNRAELHAWGRIGTGGLHLGRQEEITRGELPLWQLGPESRRDVPVDTRPTPPGPRGYRRSDEAIHDEVHALLTDHDAVDASDIVVTVMHAEVTLEGSVPTRRMKRLAEDVCLSVRGVHDVHNRLRVAGGLMLER